MEKSEGVKINLSKRKVKIQVKGTNPEANKP